MTVDGHYRLQVRVPTNRTTYVDSCHSAEELGLGGADEGDAAWHVVAMAPKLAPGTLVHHFVVGLCRLQNTHGIRKKPKSERINTRSRYILRDLGLHV